MTHPALPKLSRQEKARLVSGADLWHTESVEHAGVDGATLTDGPHGLRLQDASQDHLGVYGSRPATAFPTATALGSSWDPGLLAEVGEALGREARDQGVDILLGPGVNMKRSPLCGRNFEYFSEDPLHAGVLGSAWVAGLQSKGVGASLKHFAANNQETERMRVSAEVDERTLREIYLPAFERVVTTAQPATVMCSYNRINGVFAAENSWLLTDVLRTEWGFGGYVVSDWGAVHDPARALAAGLDLEMPSSGERSPALIVSAIEAGNLPEETLDRAVGRILTTHDRLRAARTPLDPVDWDAHHALARRAAAASAVLLENRDGFLPLDPADGNTIAVIGEFARIARFQGAGSSHVNATRVEDALTEMRTIAQRDLEFEPGFATDGSAQPELHDAAVRLAARAEAVVLFLGLPAADESEGFDREHLDLPAAQLALFDAVIAVNPRVAVVLSNGGAVRLDRVAGRSRALIEMWLGGQAAGGAAADLLFGRAAPEGRLAETIPVRLEETPAYINWPGTRDRVHYGERIYIGYRWYDKVSREVTYPFGHGLGYTSFAYSDLRVEVPDAQTPAATVRFTVTNTGDRAGADVPQVYVEDVVSSVDRPIRELKGFAKVRLEPGESVDVEVALDERAFAFWSDGAWRAEAGDFRIWVGASSRDLRLDATITLDLPYAAGDLTIESTIGEWFAHPAGAPLAMGALSALGGEGGGVDLTQGELFKMIAQLPLPRIFDLTGRDGQVEVRGLLAALD
ncbi:glycoside hydrolase family 3 C-terminal domain-containing protein [Dactylosporangium sp. CA-233914]|uniref:glycoside hydrolase family 3 C-terminal domain-containing protein n=1 Tax=Dactylosporangium sp. CA-233914 TaxID=3239934 RepID=UPI003D8C0FEB